MKKNICSDNFRNFYERIDVIGLTIEEILLTVKDNIYLLVDDIGLGKLSAMFYSPPMPIEREGEYSSTELYVNPDGYEKEETVFEFPIGNGGKTGFVLNAAKGVVWSEADKRKLSILCKTIFVMCGRARLSNIIDKTISRDINTGLANINGFMASGNKLISQGCIGEYTAMFVNIINFKYVNSRVGNKNGDKVIEAYAMRLSELIREDEVLARLGGDNFTMLIKKDHKAEILEYLAGLSIEAECSGERYRFVIESRVGAYDINEDDSMPHIMNCISSAVSAARNSTTNNVVFFDQSILKRIAHEQELMAGFLDALNNHEFVVHYQPKVNLDTHRLCGGEALVRWQKDGVLIPPGEFVPIFERDGKVCALDFYVLACVCEDIKDWLERGIEPVTISVNFSKMHLHDPDIAKKILDVIEKSKVDTRYIEIELTEMSDYSDYEAFKSLVTKMKENGINMSIDDFGTGYSSLNLLTEFMFDIVKLDKSFIDKIMNNAKTDEIVVRNIVRMVNELNMSAIAEGVETVEQEQFLKEINCTMVQGYLFDKPLTKTVFEERLKNRQY